MKTGVLLINIGTPDSPSVKDVRKYLAQFLSDPLVIDINPVLRFFLVNFIIVPFRAPKSAELYKKIWTSEGSPLIVNTKHLKQKLKNALDSATNSSKTEKGNSYIVEYCMRYQNPDIQRAFKKLINEKVEKIIAIPLYPQYASSTTGSTIKELQLAMKKENFQNVQIIEHFFQDEYFLDAWADVAKKYFTLPPGDSNGGAYDFFLFSYHGLPERQIFKECKKRGGSCNSISDTLPANGIKANAQVCGIAQSQLSREGWDRETSYCYRSACYETTRQLVKRLNIPEGKYTTSFQSRLSKGWLKPFSDEVVKEKAKQGIKRMLVFSPSFVADCLETIHEIGIHYNEIFKQHDGEKLQLVKSLNDSDIWVGALTKMILNKILEPHSLSPDKNGELQKR